MNKNKIALRLIPLLFVVGFVYVQFGMKKEREKRNLLKDESGFSIGVFESIIYTNNRASGVSFNYTIDGKSYKNADFYYYMDFPEEITVNLYNLRSCIDKFMVLYDKDNPHESIIRLDYPIKDSADFKRYVNEFEQMRKQKTKE